MIGLVNELFAKSPQDERMVALLAVAAIAGGLLVSVLTMPFLGWWAPLLAPLGGSAAVVFVGTMAASPKRQAARDRATDELVAHLQSVLPETNGEAAAERPGVGARRAAG